MDSSFLFRGFVIDLSITAPVGPIGVLCMRRTLADGRASGLLSGLGAATADAAYGCVAGFGLTLISGLLVQHPRWLRLGGGAFLIWLGLRTFLAQPAEQPGPVERRGLVGAYSSAFFLTLTNPMTILSFVAIFAGLGLAGSSANYLSAAILVLGVFLGSALWWLLLSTAVGVFRAKLTPSRLRWVNRISGVIISSYGLLALLSLL